jgi:hypothetical protein
MPRDSSGTYTLPAGNPVTTLSVISSTWANTTLSDVSTALTGSLDRSGQGAMLAGLKLFDGVIGAPGLTWGTDTTSGLYQNGAGDFRWSIFSTELLRLNTNLVQISGTAPVFRWNESDAAANNRLWDVIASGEDLAFRALTDALAATNWLAVTRTAGVIDTITLAAAALALNGPVTFNNSGLSTAAVQLASAAPTLLWFETDAAANNGKWYIQANTEALQFGAANDAFGVATNFLQVDRTGTTIDTVNVSNGTLQYGGVEVGYRQMDFVNFAISTAVTNANRAKLYRATASGTTLTFDTTLTAGALYTVSNENAAAITLAGSGVTLNWFNGTGTPTTGSRTLAAGGLATVYMLTTTAAFVWGVGLS